jgi:c(7)-type cytochrome triheme protein
MMKRISVILFLLSLVIISGMVFAQSGVKKRRPLPYEYGRVIINNFSEKAGLSPVTFEHWSHRAKFTCRLCHVDIAFAMKAGSTGIRAADNANGFYCGACHDGKTIINGKKIFESCSKKMPPEESRNCKRCHSRDKDVQRDNDFFQFTEGLPKERFGNGVNWEKAETDGYLKLIDTLEGISIRRKALNVPKDTIVEAKQVGIPKIVFSHKKHAVWNGCELCHPEIFGVTKSANKYSMSDIFEGRYCGVCHGSVAFPSLDCQRCHREPV